MDILMPFVMRDDKISYVPMWHKLAPMPGSFPIEAFKGASPALYDKMCISGYDPDGEVKVGFEISVMKNSVYRVVEVIERRDHKGMGNVKPGESRDRYVNAYFKAIIHAI